ncbi:MAG: Gfo/Idh/MocA family oxidoreductase [Acidobacteriota bacterium]|nr:Gfo/Idh/MocA family oxidoreductase [Acidobacteriota bacterium]
MTTQPPVLRYGIAGYGLMGAEHARNLTLLGEHGLRVRVTAVADPRPESRLRARRHLGEEIALYEAAGELAAAGELDAVVIASPNHTHGAVLEKLWGHRLHLLVEKPLCTTNEDCERVRERAQDHPGLVWVGMEYRYMAPVARLIEEVRGGSVGRPVMVAIREHRFPFLPKIGDWNRFNDNTGGTLVEKCCHFFDLMVQIVGKRPLRVFASGAQDVNHLDERYDGRVPDILDNAFVVVDFEDGVRGLLDLCMFAEASEHEQEIVVTGDRGKVECFLPQSLVRVGRRDLAAAEPSDSEPRRMRSDLVEEVVIPVEADLLSAGHHHGSTYWQHRHFADAIRGEREVAVSVRDGALAVAIGVAAHRSIDEGRPIELDDRS